MKNRFRIGARLALGAVVLGAATAAAQPPSAGLTLPLRFDSEVVRLEIGPDSVQIEGIYHFACASKRDSPLSLFYPYPKDSLMGGSRTLLLEGRIPGEAWAALEFEEIPGGRGARWRLPPCRAETLDVRTVYRQARRASHAVYIVTTTKAWGRPLRRARFEITLPPGATEPRFSFPFVWQAPRTPNEHARYVFEATDFLPDRDITVDWKKPQGGDR